MLYSWCCQNDDVLAVDILKCNNIDQILLGSAHSLQILQNMFRGFSATCNWGFYQETQLEHTLSYFYLKYPYRTFLALFFINLNYFSDNVKNMHTQITLFSKKETKKCCSIFTFPEGWYFYQMVTTTTLRTCERKHVLVKNNIKILTVVDLKKCLLNEVKWPVHSIRAHIFLCYHLI